MDLSSSTENIYRRRSLGQDKFGLSYKAIIVDDSQLARKALKQILLSVDFNIIDELQNGSMALFLLRNQTIQVFVDAEMPMMDGIQFVNCKTGIF